MYFATLFRSPSRGRVRPPRPSRRLTLEALEGRLAPATFTVTTTKDSGAGSLRAAILSANATPGPDAVAFNIAGGGVKTITLAGALPAVTGKLTINGASQPGFVPVSGTAWAGFAAQV